MSLNGVSCIGYYGSFQEAGSLGVRRVNLFGVRWINQGELPRGSQILIKGEVEEVR